MGRVLVELGGCLVEWSTSSDAAVSEAMTDEQAAAYLLWSRVVEALPDWSDFPNLSAVYEDGQRIMRTRKHGSSARWPNSSAESVCASNQMGAAEGSMSMTDLHEWAAQNQCGHAVDDFEQAAIAHVRRVFLKLRDRKWNGMMEQSDGTKAVTD